MAVPGLRRDRDSGVPLRICCRYVTLQTLLELHASAADAALDGTLGAPRDLGSLVVTEAADANQRERFALNRRKGMERPFEIAHLEPRLLFAGMTGRPR